MVIPVCDKHVWMDLLAGLPMFSPGSGPMVVIAPHPDDETLGIGGLIVSQRQNGVPILLIAVTDGENAYADSVRLGDVRSEEQASAAARLGVERDDILRLHCEDSNVREEQRTIVERLTPLVSSETHIVAPWPHDFHPDHEACGAAALELARAAKARLTFYFFWTWHRGTPALLERQNLQAFPLNELQRTAKADALACHVSQLSHPSGDPILHDIHLWPASFPFEVYLPG